jgi:hypothetical protein
MSTSENPYASPQAPFDPAMQSRMHSLRWVRGAGIGIVFFAAFEFLGGVIWIIVLPILFAATLMFPMKDQIPLWQTGLMWVAAIAVTARAGFMYYGATHLRSGKNYRWANAAAILSILGIFFPPTWYSVPFGIWALILLRRQKYKQMFEK